MDGRVATLPALPGAGGAGETPGPGTAGLPELVRTARGSVMTDRDEYITPAEFAAKVGKRMRTRIAFSGVPRGTSGTVLEPDDRLVSRPIQWHLPGRWWTGSARVSMSAILRSWMGDAHGHTPTGLPLGRGNGVSPTSGRRIIQDTSVNFRRER